MPRFFVSVPILGEEEIRISGREARHMRRVLRLKVGDRVDIFDGTGKEYHGQITHQHHQNVTVRIVETTSPDQESPLTLVMGQSLIKGDKMDFVIQKATEMGVSTIIPFVSSRSVTRVDPGNIEQRLNRWRAIAVESSKQCGRLIPLNIGTILGFDEALGRAPLSTRRIILCERATYRLKSLFREIDRSSRSSQSFYFIVGPEGGFTEDEVKKAEKAEFTPVSLGSRILRAETAGLSFVSILQYEWGDMG